MTSFFVSTRRVLLCFSLFALHTAFVSAAETNAGLPPVITEPAVKPGHVGLLFTHPEGPRLVNRPIESFNTPVKDAPTTHGLIEAVVNALVDGPTEEEQTEAVYGFLPAGTVLGNLEMPDNHTVKIYLDLPESFTSSPQFDHMFVHEVGEHFIDSLLPFDIAQFYFYTLDRQTGEYRPMRDFLPSPDFDKADKQAAAALTASDTSGTVSSENTIRNMPTQNGFVAGALSGKSVVLNQSHGWLDDNNPNRWRVQRTRTWETLEDYCSAMFMNQYVVPMLQNAGARVRPVREIDTQTNMVVVDNAMAAPLYSETGSGWFNSSLNGYVHKTVFSGLQDNPFGNASSTRLIRGVTSGAPTAWATYKPTIPASGYYNVYISYAAGSDRTSNAHWQVHHSGGVTDFRINQKNSGATWVLLGNFYFEQGAPAGQAQVLALNDSGDTDYLNVDAVRFGGGMGSVARRNNGVSGRPRWQEEANNYMQYTGMLASSLMSGDDTVTYDDEQLGWSNRPQYARWEQTRDGLGDNLVYVGWHTNASGWNCTGGVENGGAGRGTSIHRDVDADSTAGTINLTSLCYNSFLDSIKLAYNGTWPLRSTPIVASNSYGECNQASLGTVSGFFFEGLFHDNATDAAWYKNPRFRYAAARGIVQGVIKYYGGTVFPPEPVDNFRIRNTGGGNVQLNWVAGPVRTGSAAYGSAATKFRVYKSLNGYGFDNGVDTADATPQYTTTLPAGQTTYFRIAAVNTAGISVQSPTLAVRVAQNGAPTVSIVNGYLRNDQFVAPVISSSGIGGCAAPTNAYRTFEPRKFQSFDYTVQHANAIAAKGDYGIDSCTRDAIKGGNVSLGDYPMVFWISGQEGEADVADGVDDTSLFASERSALSVYLQNGGNLFISGSEILWDLGRTEATADEKTFVANYLKVNFVNDDSTVYNTTPAGGGIFAGLGTITYDNGTGSAYDVRFPDVVSPTGGGISCLSYSGGTGGSAAVQYAGTFGGGTLVGKVVYMGFGFETITTVANRNGVMGRVIDFFNSSEVDNWKAF